MIDNISSRISLTFWTVLALDTSFPNPKGQDMSRATRSRSASLPLGLFSPLHIWSSSSERTRSEIKLRVFRRKASDPTLARMRTMLLASDILDEVCLRQATVCLDKGGTVVSIVEVESYAVKMIQRGKDASERSHFSGLSHV